jgi:starvation-inducible DNA-binding protein
MNRSSASANGLRVLLANTYTLYLKTQNYHWNVEGAQFYSLHLLFEKQYEDLAEAIDVIAERIRSVGSSAPGSLEEFLKLKTLTEAKTGIDAKEMIKDLLESHQLICKTLSLILPEMRDAEDEGTQDLIVNRLREHQKMIWMLQSQLL